MSDWAALDVELALWASKGLNPRLWWRDDDAKAVTPDLERLLALSDSYAVPIHLSVIPEGLQPELAPRLRDAGYAFVPSDCSELNSDCRLHISFHGCRQGAEFVEDRFALNAGLNEWAAQNQLVADILDDRTAERIGNTTQRNSILMEMNDIGLCKNSAASCYVNVLCRQGC